MIKAVAYFRCSTDRQDYSIGDQQKACQRYAIEHDIDIIKEFVDEGKSGTSIKHRLGFQELFSYTESDAENFEIILVYDVSRFGRFADPDEAGFWEFKLKQSGKRVVYVEEDFENDDSTAASLIKNLKRSMAGEFSKDLAKKIMRGKKSVSADGFNMGGYAPYGYKRLLVDKNREPVKVLEIGEHKYEKTHRVVLIPGDEKDVDVVRRIFDSYVYKGMGLTAIAHMLNKDGLRSPRDNAWNRSTINSILNNPVYIGTLRFNRTYRRKPGMKIKPKQDWVVVENAHEPLIDKETFQAVVDSKRHNKATPNYNRNSRFLLTGLVKCTQCGATYMGHSRKNGTGKIYNYYECGTYLQKGKSVCRGILVQQKALEMSILKEIHSYIHQPEIARQMHDFLIDKFKVDNSQADKIKNEIKTELKRKEQEKQNILDAIRNGIDMGWCKQEADRIKSEMAELEYRLNKIKNQEKASREIELKIAATMDLILEWERLVKSKHRLQLKSVLRAFVAGVEVDSAKRVVTIRIFRVPGFDNGLDNYPHKPKGSDSNCQNVDKTVRNVPNHQEALSVGSYRIENGEKTINTKTYTSCQNRTSRSPVLSEPHTPLSEKKIMECQPKYAEGTSLDRPDYSYRNQYALIIKELHEILACENIDDIVEILESDSNPLTTSKRAKQHELHEKASCTALTN